jgi:hypothetical protein
MGRSNTTQVTHYFTISIVHWELEHGILISLIREACGLRPMLNYSSNWGVGRPTPLTAIDQRYWDTLNPHVSING